MHSQSEASTTLPSPPPVNDQLKSFPAMIQFSPGLSIFDSQNTPKHENNKYGKSNGNHSPNGNSAQSPGTNTSKRSTAAKTMYHFTDAILISVIFCLANKFNNDNDNNDVYLAKDDTSLSHLSRQTITRASSLPIFDRPISVPSTFAERQAIIHPYKSVGKYDYKNSPQSCEC